MARNADIKLDYSELFDNFQGNDGVYSVEITFADEGEAPSPDGDIEYIILTMEEMIIGLKKALLNRKINKEFKEIENEI